jgi:hypothetical protein
LVPSRSYHYVLTICAEDLPSLLISVDILTAILNEDIALREVMPGR